MQRQFVLALDDGAATLERAGGKGASLARMAAAGLPVPPGFHVTTEAYERFVEENALRAGILDAAERADAADRIAELFAAATIPDDVADEIRRAYARLGDGREAVAVRSSATAEDLPDLSFAGQQETFLNVRGDAELLDAVRRCWASLWTARAIEYRTRNRVAQDDVSIAVVVQELVPADAAGVCFTANPVTGARGRTVIDAAWGLGEAVVSGHVTPDTVVVDTSSWRVVDERIGDKRVRTVRTADGVRDEPVPEALRSRAVLTSTQAVELARLGARIEALYQLPMDVEWALHGSRVFVLQARPITTLGGDPADAEWNDSLAGDFLWSNGNLGEAVPDVMTPCTWSLVEIFMEDSMPAVYIGAYRPMGNIGGRFYMNISVVASVAASIGVGRKRFMPMVAEVFGRIPDDVEIPTLPISRWRVLRTVAPAAIRAKRRVRANQERFAGFIASAPARCEAMRERIGATSDPAALAELWRRELLPYFRECSRMLEAGAKRKGDAMATVRRRLSATVGDADANALLSGLHGGADALESLGPLVSLTRLARGEIDRETFARRYGHRSPHEFEVSTPRPAEDPEWVDRQLAGLRESPTDVDALLARQRDANAAAWTRLAERYPRKEASTRRMIERAAESFRAREAARSEVVRVFWALRAFVVRAGALTGRGDDPFFLSIGEILALLDDDESPLAHVAARRATYERYRALPPYPALIRGHFDPVSWAADPERRGDLFDATHAAVPSGGVVTGFGGAAGVVEGLARVIMMPEEGDALRAGEILVTISTNVGWTPLFPRAAAIVTDVGAPLSHAAIVARELGIPAVVGCGNATMRIATGDRLRVDGARGTVEVLDAET